jgi:hypothetical protein
LEPASPDADAEVPEQEEASGIERRLPELDLEPEPGRARLVR